MTSAILRLVLLGTLVYFATAQDSEGGLPDSVENVECITLQMNSPHVCCEPDTGSFCEVQCNNGLCKCVHPLTGIPISDFTFPDADDSAIACSLIIPDPPGTMAPEQPSIIPSEQPSEEPSEEPTPVSEGPDLVSEEATVSPTEEVEARATEEDVGVQPTVSPTEEVEARATEEDVGVQPTPDGFVGDEEEDSDSSESSESDETSFSLTDSTDTNSDSSDGGTATGAHGSESTGKSGSSGQSGTTGRTGTTGRSGSQTTGSRSNTRCPKVRDLLRRGCTEGCVMEDADGCPSCSHSCLASSSPSTGEDSDTLCSCAENQLCLRVGRFGEHKCVGLLTEGERCDAGRDDDDDDDDEDDEDDSEEDESSNDEDSTTKSKSRSVSDFDETSGSTARRRVGGARDRHLFGDLGEATIGCQGGLVCTPVEIARSECHQENAAGPCVSARRQGFPATCAPDGSFEPLQCRPVGDLFQCQCVNPSDGNEIAATAVTVANMDDAPNCDRLVGCTVQRGHQSFDVSNGDFFVNVNSCQRCRCSNGQATLCERAQCTALQRTPQACSYQGRSYDHGDTFQVDCNKCGCRNGQIRCTQRKCEESQIVDRCRECSNEPQDHVCGINGITYPSPCAAVYCFGLAPFDFVRGACSSVDFCALYPCGEGERCLRKGGVVCFNADGCDPDDLRLCVDPTTLTCVDDQENADGLETNLPEVANDNVVCATNGVTYPSVCRLLQDTGNEAVAYAGECDREECRGEKVSNKKGHSLACQFVV